MRNIKTREGFEFWDKLNALPRYAFLLSPSGKSVQKFEDQAMGNWIDVHEAQKVVDEAQELISELQEEVARQKRYVQINGDSAQGKHAEGQRYRDERDALQQRLNAADQRIDDLTPQAGWKLVPIQPTAEMLSAIGADAKDPALAQAHAAQHWAAMIEAVPSQPDQLRDAVKMIAALNPNTEAESHE
ncbi:hypothetical protein ACTJK9_01350 [Pseudomonas sp. 22082]|uniref:hypothetical protein n=1 Tax=Pseudomonas sp. 22082 TaxID=3453868 RepID=UPI003F84D19E